MLRPAHCGSLRSSVFQQYNKFKPPTLRVSTTVNGALIPISDFCIAKKRKYFKITTMLQENFPTELNSKYMEQLQNVYSKIIFPSQFLPQLITESSKQELWECGYHESEVLLPIEQYSMFTDYSIPLHCRQYCKYSSVYFFVKHTLHLFCCAFLS